MVIHRMLSANHRESIVNHHESPQIIVNHSKSIVNVCKSHKSSQITANTIANTSYLFNTLKPNDTDDETFVVFIVSGGHMNIRTIIA